MERADLSVRKREYTLGVEEEYQIVDAGSRGLEPRGGSVLERAQKTLGEQAVPELRASQVEVVTSVCRTLAEVRAELVWLRRVVGSSARRRAWKVAG
jgi:carboxylate-amine ligase